VALIADSAGGTEVTVVFSEVMDQTSAEDPNNYELIDPVNGNIQPDSATLRGDGVTVDLVFSRDVATFRVEVSKGDTIMDINGKTAASTIFGPF
jgi:hypothetical protein